MQICGAGGHFDPAKVGRVKWNPILDFLKLPVKIFESTRTLYACIIKNLISQDFIKYETLYLK